MVFGATGRVLLENVPVGRFHDQLAKLSPAARERALKHLGDSHVPLVDVNSLLVDQDGMLIYACTFIPRGAPPPPDGQPASLEIREEGVAAIPVPISVPPVRHSKPGAPNVIYLDFSGHTLTDTAWNDSAHPTYIAKPFDKDGDPTTFSDAEQADIVRIWERVAEDYRPFNVDVTTEEPVTFTASTGRILITPNVDANGASMPAPGSAGVAYVGVFGYGSYPNHYSPALVYSNVLSNNESYIAEAASHEMGHNMGLSHDGLQAPANPTGYYGGHGSGETSWGPIMGTDYNRNVSQWSKGEYYGANNMEDDLAIISGRVGYRTDDVADTNATATPLGVAGNVISASGVIGQSGEADRFSFTTAAGSVSITASPFRSTADTYGGNLDIQMELIDAGNNVISTTSPAGTTGLTLNTTLVAGTYYLRITGEGAGSPLSSTPSGYTSYGSLGSYTLSGTIGTAAFGKFSAGRYHSLRIDSAFRLYATGANTYGQLGTGDTTTFSTPQLITISGQTVVGLAAGAQHSLIQTSANDLWATGINDNGQLGDGTVVAKATPRKVATNVAGLAAGVYHSAYLKTDGTLWTVGLNDVGQLGTGNLTELHSASQIATNVVDLAVGTRQTLFVKSDGTLWGVGDLFGNGTLTSTPSQLAMGVKTVAAGAAHSLILKTDNSLWALGKNSNGQLGTGNLTTTTVPILIATGVKAIAAGYFHSAFIKLDNTLWICGYNNVGQLGNGSNTQQLTAFQLATNVAAVSASESYTLFMKTDGSLWGTGLNANGQFGNGLTTNVTAPVQIGVSTILVPGAPTNVAAVPNAAADRLNLTWQPVGNAAGFEIWRSTINSFGSATRIAQNVRWAFYQDLTASAYTTYYYWVTAVNSAGTSPTSVSGTGSYGAQTAPSFTTQPLPQSVAARVTATFTVVTSGFPTPALQWQRLPNGSSTWVNLTNGGNYSGATSATLTVTNTSIGMKGDQFRCRATNSVSSVNSNAVLLTITSSVANDFNGDGKTDLVWQNSVTGARFVWLMNGMSLGSEVALGTIPTDWKIAATTDFNGDGKPDVLWENTVTGDHSIWLMNGFSFLAGCYLGTIPTQWKVASSADFNGDGKSDLLWSNTVTGDHAIWLLDGVLFLAGGYLGQIPTAWSVACTGDLNGDGKADLVWQNNVTGERTAWLMNGTTFLAGGSLGNVPTAWKIAGTADFNGDGKSDLLWENTVTGDHTIWLMNGVSFLSGAMLGNTGPSWQIESIGDYNGDSKPDLIWKNTLTGERALWLLNGTSFLSGASLGVIGTQWQIAQ